MVCRAFENISYEIVGSTESDSASKKCAGKKNRNLSAEGALYPVVVKQEGLDSSFPPAPGLYAADIEFICHNYHLSSVEKCVYMLQTEFLREMPVDNGNTVQDTSTQLHEADNTI